MDMDMDSNKKIELESEIIQIIRKDNSRGNTIHFIYGLATLEVVTRNVFNGQIFLLKRFFGAIEDCLEKALEYVESKDIVEHSFTVFWTDEKGDSIQSYFRATDKKEVESKFHHSGNKSKIDRIKQNPLS